MLANQLKQRPHYLLPLFLSLPVSSLAQTESSTILKPIIVTANRTASDIQGIPSNVTVITSEQSEFEQAKDLQELFRYTPGVNFDGAGRFGISDIRIRGVSDNRVQLRLDGIPLPEEYSFGPFQSSGRQYFDISNLKQTEIIRGPSSSLYGSSAIGGVASFKTKSPSDYLKGDDTFGGNIHTGFSGDNNEGAYGLNGAAKLTQDLAALISYNYRDGNETESFRGLGGKGPDRERANPQSIDSHDINSKLVYNYSDNSMFTFIGQFYQQDSDTNLLSNAGVETRGALRQSLTAEDEQQREAYSIKHDFVMDNALTDGGHWQVYYQDTETNQRTDEEQISFASEPNTVLRNSNYQNEGIGLDIQLEKEMELYKSTHQFVYGVSYKNEDITMLRESNSSIGLSDIEKNFPDSDLDEFGLFLQDSIGFYDDKFQIIPGVRYDHYNLNPTNDDIFLATSGNIRAVDINENEVSYRLGSIYNINKLNSIYFNYSQGFRAPAFDDANVGFTNFQGGYTTIANPNLKPERSHGFELGVKGRSDKGSYEINTFYTRYNNFIDNLGGANFNPQTALLEFQTINLDSAEIWGVEFSGQMNLETFIPFAKGFSLKGSLAYADGENRLTNDPISTIEPINGNIGLTYESQDKVWSVSTIVELTAGKSNSNIAADSIESNITGTAGYSTVDLLGYYQLTPKTKINVGVFNLFDKKHIEWGQAQTLTADNRARFTESGRYASVTLSHDF